MCPSPPDSPAAADAGSPDVPEGVLQGPAGLERARRFLSARSFPGSDAPTEGPEVPGHVGLEPERFVLRVDERWRPVARLPLTEVVAAVDRAVEGEAALKARDPEDSAARFDLAHGGSVTFEPGGQIEHSTAVHPGASAAIDDVRGLAALFERAFDAPPNRAPGLRLLSLGLDPWFTTDDVPQQLRAPRYESMAAYLAKRSPAGAWMMRCSCTLQVNLDQGGAQVLEDRYALANLLSPAFVTSFSTSPELPGTERVHCRRARVWQTLDPTRSGFPSGFLTATDRRPGTAAAAYAEAALDADVLLIPSRAAGHHVAGEPGFNLRDWILNGHPDAGFPTEGDLATHLTTLFFEVRSRGFYELRAIDALPDCWRPAAVVFACGLLLDPTARGQALEYLEPTRPGLLEDWRRAAREGWAWTENGERTARLWGWALEGAARLDREFLREDHLREAHQFHERFVARRRAPADEFREALSRGPEAASRWAASLGCGEERGHALV